MNEVMSKLFLKKYKRPYDNGTQSLYRFSAFDPKTVHYHEALFCDKNLFHNAPSYFNDPFECRPILEWPKTDKEMNAFREDLVSLMLIEQIDMQDAVRRAYSFELNCSIISDFEQKLLEEFQSFRLCCFTKRKDNLLFWSHYGDSHKGYCVEYSTKGQLLSQVYKVRYTDKFPSLTFPMFGDIRKLYLKSEEIANHNKEDKLHLDLDMKIIEPILTKSKDWKYEDEYRSIYKPGAPLQLANNDTSLVLNGDEITNVYFGCNMPQEHREQLIEMIKHGPFEPKLWQAEIMSSRFDLNFNAI
jgi:hypothetical protein